MHLPVFQASSPSEPLLSPTDYRTKSPSSEKELFHILPKLQAKRADFLTVMLTGSLHQRRAFTATPPDTQDEGPQDDDVTKSESSSGVSGKSTERSQDGAPFTLVAEGPKELGSVADVDPDQEDVSKTLVLFSPGDMKKSLNAMNGTEMEQCVLGSDVPQNEQTGEGGRLEEDVNQFDPSIPTSKPVITISTAAVVSGSVSSPPFSKVERTFIHIAETTHLNIMSSNSAQVKEGDLEGLMIPEKVEGRSQTKQITDRSFLSPERGERACVLAEVTSQTTTEEPQGLKETSDKNDILIVPVSPDTKDFDRKQETQPEEENQKKPASILKLSEHPLTRSKSRIPILAQEEDTRTDQLLSNRERLRRRAVQQDLAREAVERQRQGRWKRLNSRTSSSLSSGDDPKRASETFSMTGSEEDIHEPDGKLNKLKKEAEVKNVTGWHSRIPRPVTPIRRLSSKLTVAASEIVLTEANTKIGGQTSRNG